MQPIHFNRTPIPASALLSPANVSSLAGSSILITGGASGFGAAFARTLASHGVLVTIADINPDTLYSVTSDLVTAGHKVRGVTCDVRDWKSNIGAFRAAVRFGGNKLDHVILNAGVMDTPFFTAASRGAKHVDDEADGLLDEPDSRVIDVCCKGVMYGLKLAQVYLCMEGATGDKSVMVTGSPESYLSLPGAVNYAGGKYGVRGLWRASRELFGAVGVRSNMFVPWLMPTNMNAGTPLEKVLLGENIHFTPIDTHVAVALHLLTDSSIAGRAIALGEPGGTVVDLEDDEAGFDGSKKYWELLHTDLPGVRDKLANMYKLLGFEVDRSMETSF